MVSLLPSRGSLWRSCPCLGTCALVCASSFLRWWLSWPPLRSALRLLLPTAVARRSRADTRIELRSRQGLFASCQGSASLERRRRPAGRGRAWLPCAQAGPTCSVRSEASRWPAIQPIGPSRSANDAFASSRIAICPPSSRRRAPSSPGASHVRPGRRRTSQGRGISRRGLHEQSQDHRVKKDEAIEPIRFRIGSPDRGDRQDLSIPSGGRCGLLCGDTTQAPLARVLSGRQGGMASRRSRTALSLVRSYSIRSPVRAPLSRSRSGPPVRARVLSSTRPTWRSPCDVGSGSVVCVDERGNG